jgi:tellurite resistance protein
MVTSPPVPRIPLNTLAIPLGLAGLADVWSDTTKTFGLPVGIAQIFWVIAAVGWVWMIAAHVRRGRRSWAPLSSQLTHPVQGPLASLVPIVGMALAADLVDFWRLGGVILGIASITASALYAGWLVSSWTTGSLELESIHGGYFLPTVAAGYIAAFTAAELGSRSVAIGAFAIATFFWVALFTLLIARLAFRPALPAPLIPTLAIMMAPPAVAARAWFAIAGPASNPVQEALAALAVLMVLVELGLLRRYLGLSFSLGFWSFTFPTAAIADLAIAWLGLEHPSGWKVLVWALLIGVSVLVAAIGYRSARAWHRSRPAAAPATTVSPAEEQLTRADDLIAPVEQKAQGLCRRP